jgi:solute carrier family 8 (sodium/calcium exchanger)
MGIGIIAEVFMEGIEKITAQKKIIEIKKDGEVIKSKKVDVWNATVANLTLMALGSSAPEILLAVLETVMNLNGCPGELGASTIVGSAAFNLLVISGVSVLAVNEKNDNSEDRDETVPKGIKKINDMGVFGTTAIFSLWAYIWLLIVLMDQVVQMWEGVLTFVFFFILIVIAFGMDRYKASQEKDEEDEGDDGKLFIEFSALEIYRELITEK